MVKRLGLKVAFVGLEIAPIEFAAAPGHPGTAWARPDQIAQAVQGPPQGRCRRRHLPLGIEKQTLETARQRELAEVAVRAGARGGRDRRPPAHAQPVRRQGGAIVAYSLGNFVFGAQSPETTTTGILEPDLTAEGVAKGNWRAAWASRAAARCSPQAPRRLPMRDDLRMEAGVNLPEL